MGFLSRLRGRQDQPDIATNEAHIAALKITERNGRSQVADAVTERLSSMETNIRESWVEASRNDPHLKHHHTAYYAGQIEAYNRVAVLIHELDNTEQVNAKYLPQILDHQEMKRYVDHVASYGEAGRQAEQQLEHELQADLERRQQRVYEHGHEASA